LEGRALLFQLGELLLGDRRGGARGLQLILERRQPCRIRRLALLRGAGGLLQVGLELGAGGARPLELGLELRNALGVRRSFLVAAAGYGGELLLQLGDASGGRRRLLA